MDVAVGANLVFALFLCPRPAQVSSILSQPKLSLPFKGRAGVGMG